MMQRMWQGLIEATIAISWTWDIQKPDYKFFASAEIGSVADVGAKVVAKIEEMIDKVREAIQWIGDLLWKISSFGHSICQKLEENGKLNGKLGRSVCNEVADKLQDLARPIISTAEWVCNEVLNAINTLIDNWIGGALDSAAAIERFFSIQKMELWGELGADSARIGASIDLTFLGNQYSLAAELDVMAIGKSIWDAVKSKASDLSQAVTNKWNEIKDKASDLMEEFKGKMREKMCGGTNEWGDGSFCLGGTTCKCCQNSATHWWGKGGRHCGNEQCRSAGSCCWGGSTCRACCIDYGSNSGMSVAAAKKCNGGRGGRKCKEP